MPPDATTDVITAGVNATDVATADPARPCLKTTDRLQHTRADGSVEYIEGVALGLNGVQADLMEVTERTPGGHRHVLAYVRLAPGESIRYTRRIPVAE